MFMMNHPFLMGSTGDPLVDAWIIEKCDVVNRHVAHIYAVVLSILVLGTLVGIW